MSHPRARPEFNARERLIHTAEARVTDLKSAVDALASVRRTLQREDLSEIEVVSLALERTQHGLDYLEPRLEKAVKGRGIERRREKEGRP